jgi:hypothetical protein
LSGNVSIDGRLSSAGVLKNLAELFGINRD